MGANQSIYKTYSTTIENTTTEGCTAIYRASTHPDALVENFSHNGLTNEDVFVSSRWELFQRGIKITKGDGKCIGYRKRAPDASLAPAYSWLSFKEIETLALTFGTNLLNTTSIDFKTSHFPQESYKEAQSMKLFGLYSKNRYEWFVCELGASAYGWTLVPLYDSLNHEGLVCIFKQTKMELMACSLECLEPLLTAIEETRFIKTVILFLDPHEKIMPQIEEKAKKCGVILIAFDDMIKQPTTPFNPVTPTTLDSINTLCYTSGTTGLPKGVLLTNQNLVACVAALIRGPIVDFFHLNSNDTTISYLPLAHVLERYICCFIFSFGASIGLYSGDTKTLLEDIQVLNPTIFVSVPRLFNRINDAVFSGVARKSLIERYLFLRAKASKLEKLRSNAQTTNKVWDTVVFKKTKKLMGTNIRYMISGGAPLEALVQEHMKILFCVPLMEGYGLTESFGPAFLTSSKDPVAGHVGGPLPCVEFKLMSVPELNYSVTDEHPSGELLLRGPSITVGYFGNKEETDQVIDADGWFHTGDIAVLLPSGAIKLIDRKKNIFKLAQGEYVAPEKIENIYSQTGLISQIFVFGYSDKTFLVAIVVPDEGVVEQWSKSIVTPNNSEKGSDQSTNLPLLKKEILKEMDKVAVAANLKGFEKVKDIYIETDPFSIENNLLTPTLKIKRHATRNKYEKEIQKMYHELEKKIS